MEAPSKSFIHQMKCLNFGCSGKISCQLLHVQLVSPTLHIRCPLCFAQNAQFHYCMMPQLKSLAFLRPSYRLLNRRTDRHRLARVPCPGRRLEPLTMTSPSSRSIIIFIVAVVLGRLNLIILFFSIKRRSISLSIRGGLDVVYRGVEQESLVVPSWKEVLHRGATTGAMASEEVQPGMRRGYTARLLLPLPL